MEKYEFVQDTQKKPVIISYGQLGACQLLNNKFTKQFAVLKLAPKSQCINDIKCLSRLNHPNIIKILQHYELEQNVLIIFQFIPSGDLFTKMRCKQIKKEKIPAIFRGICLAIQYIHQKKIIHRNLKSETILLDSHMNPKLIDFGLAARLSTRKTYCGCFYYMSPELLNSQKYNQKVDIWALGVILYELIYDQIPFNGQTAKQILTQIKNWSFYYTKHPRGSAQQLIKLMLHQDNMRRISIKKVLSHPYLQVQKLNFFNQPSKKITFKSTEKTNKILMNRSGYRKYSENHSQITEMDGNKKTSLCQKLGIRIKNKIEAIKDPQKIKFNHRYNYVIDQT